MIVTLPGRTITELRAGAHRAARHGADLGEVRIDRLSDEERGRLAELFPSPLPLLATVRSRAEGGEGPDDPEDRERLLSSAAQLPFDAVDYESARDRIPSGGRRAISSAHLGQGSGGSDIRRRLLGGSPSVWFVKVVVPASLGTALTLVQSSVPSPGEAPYVLHTTGPSGPLLRAWGQRLGMSASYSALPRVAGDGPAIEPAQIPVDRLRWFFDAPSAAPLFGLLGHPVDGSESPRLHSSWYRATGRRALYIPLDVESETELSESLGPLAVGGFRGLNVTQPWKIAALALSTESSRGASACGCANTLTLSEGKVAAENTDLAAVLRRLRELRSAGRWDGGRLHVVGSGGAARASLAAANASGFQASVTARRPEAGLALAREFGAEAGLPSADSGARLMIHATSAGRKGSDPPSSEVLRAVPERGHVLDFVYNPADPFLKAAAEQRQSTYEDGWRLLVYQALESFRVWWETSPPDDLVERQLREGPCAE